MVVVNLSDREFNLLKKIRNKLNLGNRHESYDITGSLKEEIDRQRKNIKELINFKQMDMKPFDLSKLKFKKNKNNFYKKIEKTEKIGSELYKVTYEDKGDGEGIVETDRKLLKNNEPQYNSSISSFSNSSSYSKIDKIKNINGKPYKVTYEDKGDGKGLVEINRVEMKGSNKPINLSRKVRSSGRSSSSSGRSRSRRSGSSSSQKRAPSKKKNRRK